MDRSYYHNVGAVVFHLPSEPVGSPVLFHADYVDFSFFVSVVFIVAISIQHYTNPYEMTSKGVIH